MSFSSVNQAVSCVSELLRSLATVLPEGADNSVYTSYLSELLVPVDTSVPKSVCTI